MSHPMKPYHDLMRRVITDGVVQHNKRTGIDCYVIPGAQLQFDLREGFPAITTKQLYFKSVVAELIGFFRGVDNAADFRALGTKIWDANANSTPAWLANPARKGEDDLGRIYGVQYTRMSDKRVAKSEDETAALINRGYRVVLRDREQGSALLEREINQLENALSTILTNPSDRRIIVSAWRPDELDLMALPPCPMDYRYIALEDRRELHLVMTQRSWDGFLGWNIPTAALFLEVMARLSGYTAATITCQFANVHIYANHLEQVELMLSREHFPQPTLRISDEVKPITDLADVKNAFANIEPRHFELDNYQHHSAIKAPMAA